MKLRTKIRLRRAAAALRNVFAWFTHAARAQRREVAAWRKKRGWSGTYKIGGKRFRL